MVIVIYKIRFSQKKVSPTIRLGIPLIAINFYKLILAPYKHFKQIMVNHITN